jgi:hypothetical protein
MKKIHAPKIKLPKLRTPKLRAPKLRSPQIRTPRFLNNLFRDLRDRRLLFPALALLVALIAVPVLLKSSASSAPPPPPLSSAGAAKEVATEPAVVTQQLGITDYRKRLERFKSKNPFRQHFTAVPKGAKLKTTSGSLPTSSSTSSATSPLTITGSGSSSTSISPVTSTSSTSTTATGSVTSTTPPTSTTSNDSTTSHHHHHHSAPKPVTELVQRRIDVKVGTQDAMVEKDCVRQLAFLPNATNPLVAYLGANEAGTKAFFLVSSDVASTSGDGVCSTTTPVCQYFTLKVGEVETFEYTPDPGTPHKLRLKSINDVVTKQSSG